MSGTCTVVNTPLGPVTHIQVDDTENETPHRLIILMDVSGSMSGQWLIQQKNALVELLDLVTITDIIVIAFNTYVMILL
jgi:uncharacterized protein with von Willebrand factor type A (vWA) domain